MNLSFNPSVEGQLLQLPVEAVPASEWEFQSLCRGTAIATTFADSYKANSKIEFQSLCRGTAIATLWIAVMIITLLTMGFNPSVEGQLLQLSGKHVYGVLPLFQSLCRGTAIATRRCPVQPLAGRKFQSLCRGTAIATHLWCDR